MLIIFKSKSCADVIMLEENGREMLGLMGKDRSAGKGIVTVEQLPEVIAALQRAIAQQRTSGREAQEPATADAGDDTREVPVQLFQRAQPVLALLERALHQGTPVTWGV